MPELFTLEDVARRFPPTTLTSVVISEFRQSVLLDRATFKGITNAHEEYRRETELPTPQRRRVHEAFSRTRSTTTLGTESLRIYGTRMGRDRFIEKVGAFDIVAETRSHTRAIRLLLEFEMIFGDPLDDDDPGQIQGFQHMTDNSIGKEAETSLSAGTTAGGAALSLRLIQRAIDFCHPAATMLVMGKEMRNIVTAGSRDVNVSGHINWESDSFGRRIAFFDDLPIIAMDRDHLNRRILGFTEAAVSGSPTATSIYVVSHNIADGGWYPFMNGGPFIEEDITQADPIKERDIEWFVGVIRPQPWGVIRIKHIGDLDMVQ